MLEKSDRFMSAQEVFEGLRANGNTTGLATVYRGLQALVKSGFCDAIRRPDGDVVYRQCSKHHHHHLICEGCGKTHEISAKSVEIWAKQMAGEYGFTNVSHAVELTGLCTDCALAEEQN